MFKKSVILLIVLSLLTAGLLIAGCEPEEPEETGALIDDMTITREESHAAAVSQIRAGDLDVFGFNVTDPDLYDEILADDEVDYELNYGSYSEIRFNPWGPEFDDGVLNPFSVPEIREAANWLFDREYMVEEILGGLGSAKYTVLGTAFPDYNERYPHIIEEIEAYYATNQAKAEEVITEEMENLGAELIDGTWYYEGEVVELKFLIRSDLPPYPEAGDYVADLYAGLGFEIERMYRTGGEASPIWIGSHPREGQWHVYTGGWSSPTIPRDQGSIFDQMYTHRVMPFPLWSVLEEMLEDFPELNEASDRLARRDFSTMDEREELFETALWESMKFSNTIWIMDLAGANPYRADIKVAVDSAGGVGDPSWPYTIHRHEDGEPVPGGSLKLAVPNILVDPWNPVAGSAFTYDMLATRRALGDVGTLADPRDGLFWPQRIESAEVYVQEGLPVDVTHDWLTLTFEDEIEVPLDAWADWDAEAQQWITVEERFGSGGTTAQRKSVVQYPDDIFDFPLHDGSTLSIGDFVLAMIMTFDRGKEASPIFDEGRVGEVEALLESFRGMKITSEDPLTIEYYTNTWYMDAEWNVTPLWPTYGTYDWSGFWHMITLGKLAEADNALTFSESKADTLGVDWMDYTKGPSLPILEERLETALEANYIPYQPTLGEYISADEAEGRWSNLKAFYEEWGHFWAGAGPYILRDVYPVEDIIVMVPFEDYPDPADKWFFFLEPLDAME